MDMGSRASRKYVCLRCIGYVPCLDQRQIRHELNGIIAGNLAYGVLSVSDRVSRIDSRMREMFPTMKELARRPGAGH